jgi:hypothetical protein
VGARAPRAFAAAADATLAAERAERAAAAQAVAGGRARQPSLHAIFARTTPAAAQKGRAARRQRAYDEQSEGPGAHFEQATTGRLVRGHQVETRWSTRWNALQCCMLKLPALSALSACCLPACRPPAPMRTRDDTPPSLPVSQVPLSVGAAGKMAARSHD